jgi:hypothetical protein
MNTPRRELPLTSGKANRFPADLTLAVWKTTGLPSVKWITHPTFFGGLGLDLMLAFLAPHDQPDLGGIAEGHRWAGVGLQERSASIAR